MRLRQKGMLGSVFLRDRSDQPHQGEDPLREARLQLHAQQNLRRRHQQGQRQDRLFCGGDINKVNGKTAFDAAEQGDPDAKEVLDTYFGYLATGLVNIINIFQPDVLCIGGGISNQGENLLRPLRKIIEEERYTKHNDKQTQLCTCTLGNDAGIIGAAFLD